MSRYAKLAKKLIQKLLNKQLRNKFCDKFVSEKTFYISLMRHGTIRHCKSFVIAKIIRNILKGHQNNKRQLMKIHKSIIRVIQIIVAENVVLH